MSVRGAAPAGDAARWVEATYRAHGHVELRHGDVHDDDVRPEAQRQRDRFAPVRRLAHHLHVAGGADERPEDRAHDGMVIRDEH
ncbi:MAG TPA: hypothetical protein VFS00_17985, partial [Polyangiaceae bacterium]|nr:hypothetical protein [Polyangiaceae bacterium]